MASQSDLTDEQKASIRAWADEGESLGQIQARLREEFELEGLTFLDTRLLLADLGISLKEEEKKTVQPAEAPAGAGAETQAEAAPMQASMPAPVPVPEAAEGAETEGPGEPGGAGEEGVPEGSGKAAVTMHEVTPPGMVAAGSVTFSDGEKAEWYFDQTGRLGLDPEKEGYRPSEADVVAFQDELQRQAGGM
jgi:hypothetical protein